MHIFSVTFMNQCKTEKILQHSSRIRTIFTNQWDSNSTFQSFTLNNDLL